MLGDRKVMLDEGVTICAALVGSQVLAAAVMNCVMVWDIAPCNLYVDRRFGGAFLNPQGRKSSEPATAVRPLT
jgi:hypothetical protein